MFNKKEVFFDSCGCRIAADLYVPDGYLDEPKPGIILCHGFAGVKELLLPAYAKEFAKKGFISLVFDYRGFGKSEGEKGRLAPKLQIEDIKNAIDYFSLLKGVDNLHIGLWGTSFGGANAIVAASEDNRIKCLCVQLTFGDGERVITSTMTSEQSSKFKDMIAKMQRKKAATGREMMVPISKVLTDEQSKDFYNKYSKDFPGLQIKYLF